VDIKSKFLDKLLIIIFFSLIFSCSNEKVNSDEKYLSTGFTIENQKIIEYLNDKSLPDISVDSVHFNKDTLETFITDNYHSHIHELMIDQMISFIFLDFSRISSSDFKELKIFLRTPKREENQKEYFLLYQISLREMKSNLRMYANLNFRRIIDGILNEHKNNPEDDILETLNTFTNEILTEDKKIEFQFFGYDFRIFLVKLLLECESGKGTYFREATKKIFDRIEENNLNSKDAFENIRNLFKEGCEVKPKDSNKKENI
jgi:hypothetical protein